MVEVKKVVTKGQRHQFVNFPLRLYKKTPYYAPALYSDEMKAFIEKDRQELLGDFCRGCGYCMPCTVDITINQCARMSQMIRRAPSAAWLSEHWQNEMMKIESCVDCGICMTRCPYELKIPQLLRKNLADYKEILAGNVKV